MKYRFDGEDYTSLKALAVGPIRTRHRDVIGCFIEDGHLVVQQAGGSTEIRYPVIERSASLTEIGAQAV